jgi:hypothetical protein
MKINNLLLLPLLTILLNLSCNKSPTEYNDNVEPGRRDYIWTIDTLEIYSPALKIWGSSPTDIWTISESDHYSNFLHFDGTQWTKDGVYRNVLPHALFGFSSEYVFVGGLNGKIWRFDGNSWLQIAELGKEGTDFIAFENIWGESPSDFYAVGNGPDKNLYANYSVISHFKNNKWEMINTGDLIGDVVHLYKNYIDEKIYLQVIKIGGTEFHDSTLIYEYNGISYNNIYRSAETIGVQADISLINKEVYFILGNEIALRRNDQFQTLLKINNPNFYQRIWGRNYKDIFLLMTDGLAHYNGNNVEYLFYFKDFNIRLGTEIYDTAIFENEIFLVAYEYPTQQKIIYHGVIKQ